MEIRENRPSAQTKPGIIFIKKGNRMIPLGFLLNRLYPLLIFLTQSHVNAHPGIRRQLHPDRLWDGLHLYRFPDRPDSFHFVDAGRKASKTDWYAKDLWKDLPPGG